jgi:hypothetical protein
VAGAGAVIFTVLFIAIVQGASTKVAGLWMFLLLSGELLAVAVFIGLHEQLQPVDPSFALLALLLSVAGSIGGVVHGAAVLADIVKAPAPGTLGVSGAEVDPRGILRYGVTGLALLLFAWLLWRDGRWPTGFTLLTALGGVLLVVIYIGRLTLWITPTNKPTLTPPVLYGGIVNPAWYFWLAALLRRRAVP